MLHGGGGRGNGLESRELALLRSKLHGCLGFGGSGGGYVRHEFDEHELAEYEAAEESPSDGRDPDPHPEVGFGLLCNDDEAGTFFAV